MSFSLDITEEASIEIIDVYLYYEMKRPGLGEEFLTYLDIYFNRITSNPEYFPQKSFSRSKKLLHNI
ncbi:hypothetical protein HC174_11535 [Salinimicrobium sp. CDJ15-81-2]|nr:hypothetical protein [Salinimicrobium nanhaiense]